MSPIVTRHSARPDPDPVSPSDLPGGGGGGTPQQQQQPPQNPSSQDRQPPPKEKITYDVWENLPLLPFHLLTHELHFTASFADRDDGVVSWIHAPMGFVSTAVYSVHAAAAAVSAGAEQAPQSGGMELEEHIETTCPVFFKVFVEATMVGVRRKMHERLIERVMAQAGGQVG
nr:hypothetical protein CFP56_64645 [Quercus suber]